MQKEIIKPLNGYEEIYKISSYGYVINSKGFKLKLNKNTQGYLHCSISKNGISKTITIHKLIAINFLNYKNDNKLLCIDHINNNKLDNRVENLHIITQRKNVSKDVKNKTSKYTGVCWNKQKNKWTSSYTLNRFQKHIGTFNCETIAHIKYLQTLKINNII